MTAEDDPRDAAIERHNERTVQDQKAAAEQRRQHDAGARQQEQYFTAWIPAAQAIYLGVNAANEYFARRESRYVISPVPTTAPCAGVFEIRPSGQLNCEAWFKFAVDGDGMVQIETDARGVADLPDAAVVAEVTSGWAQKVADQAMIAVLDGQRVHVED